MFVSCFCFSAPPENSRLLQMFPYSRGKRGKQLEKPGNVTALSSCESETLERTKTESPAVIYLLLDPAILCSPV